MSAEPPPPGDGADVFSPSELALVALLAEGYCLDAIARHLALSERTVRRRSRALCDRLGVSSTVQVVAWAARRRLI
jgi:DNA-binding NarL/FixJ family response regulator